MPGEYPKALSAWDMESVRAFVRLVAAATELRTALSASVGDGGALMAAVACAAMRSAGVVKFTAHTQMTTIKLHRSAGFGIRGKERSTGIIMHQEKRKKSLTCNNLDSVHRHTSRLKILQKLRGKHLPILQCKATRSSEVFEISHLSALLRSLAIFGSPNICDGGGMAEGLTDKVVGRLRLAKQSKSKVMLT